MTGNDREFHHRVPTQIGVKVTAAKSNILQANHHIACLHLLFGDVDNLHLPFPSYLYCFHIYMVQMRCARSRLLRNVQSLKFKVQVRLLTHIFNIRELGQVAEAIEAIGILAQEEALLGIGELGRLLNEIVRHAIGDGRDGARIV